MNVERQRLSSSMFFKIILTSPCEVRFVDPGIEGSSNTGRQ